MNDLAELVAQAAADAPGRLAIIEVDGRSLTWSQLDDEVGPGLDPSRVEVVDTLPLSVTGKVQKGRLRGLERRRARELLP